MSKLQMKLVNFRNALRRLAEAVAELGSPGASDVVRDGVIQRSGQIGYCACGDKRV